MRPKRAARLEILSGWKEIANYLGMGVRTVQRYENELGLPIRRPAGKSRAAVMALKTEIDGWINTAPDRTHSTRKPLLAARTNRMGADFLQIDSQIALTFSGIALETSNREKRRRTTQVARKAYDTIMRLREDINLNETESDNWTPISSGCKASFKGLVKTSSLSVRAIPLSNLRPHVLCLTAFD